LETHDANGEIIRQVIPADQFMPTLMGERQCYYVVSVPGENGWVNGQTVKLQQQDVPKDKDLQILHAKHPLGVGPMEAGDAPGQPPSSIVALVPGSEKGNDFKLHQVYEFYGLIEYVKEEINDTEEMDSFALRLPRPSLVPRLHVICHRPYQVKTGNTDLSATRTELVNRFARDLLGGDVVAAEWLLIHLVSSIFHRSPGFSVGSLPLNMTFPRETQTVNVANGTQLHDYLSNLLPRTLLLPLSISFLNSNVFTPVMSDSNGLQAGLLQLARGTQLIVDETTLSTGTLKGNGVLNVHALKSVLQHGKLPVGVPAAVAVEEQGEELQGEAPREEKAELTLGWMETDVDVNVLVYGDVAKSGILPIECVVPVQVDQDPSHAMAGLTLDDSFTDRARDYFARVKELSYATDDMSKFIVTDFTVSREQSRRYTGATLSLPDEEAMKGLMATEEDLAHLCNVARWMAVSWGGDKVATLTREHWLQTKKLELYRRRRVAQYHPKSDRTHIESVRPSGMRAAGSIGGMVV
jgi:hypothetical protein